MSISTPQISPRVRCAASLGNSLCSKTIPALQNKSGAFSGAPLLFLVYSLVRKGRKVRLVGLITVTLKVWLSRPPSSSVTLMLTV